MKTSHEHPKFINPSTNTNQYYAQLNTLTKTLQKNNKEISSIILASKSQGFSSPRPRFSTQTSEKTEQTLKNSYKNLSEEAKLYLSKEKLAEDRAKKLRNLTYRQDISHLLNEVKKPSTTTSTNFFKDRNFSQPYVSMSSRFANPLKTLYQDVLSPRVLQENPSETHKAKSLTTKNPQETAENLAEKKLDSSLIRVNKSMVQKNQDEMSSFVRQSPNSKKFDALKKVFPSQITANPANRLEIVLLIEWLEASLKSLSEEKDSDEEKHARKLWELFEICYKELERQVLFECNERGRLLLRLWDVLQELKQKDKAALSCAKEKLEISSIEEYNRLHAMYRLQLQQKQDIIDKFQRHCEELTRKQQEINKEKLAWEQREHQMTRKLAENTRILQLMKKKMKIITVENEKLLRKAETQAKSPLNQKRSNEEISSNEQSSEENIAMEMEEQTMTDLNAIAIINIPEKPRSELYKDESIEITADFKELNYKEVMVQSELTLLGEIYEKVMINNKNCQEMADDFYYKKEVEEEEFLKFMTTNEQKDKDRKTQASNKEEIDKIKQKLQEYKEKHKGESLERPKEPSISDKFKGAISKLKALKSLKSQEDVGFFHNEERSPEEIDKLMRKPSDSPDSLAENPEKKEKDYETEEEESENEARNDEERQENIIKELNHETSSSSSQSLPNNEEFPAAEGQEQDEINEEKPRYFTQNNTKTLKIDTNYKSEKSFDSFGSLNSNKDKRNKSKGSKTSSPSLDKLSKNSFERGNSGFQQNNQHISPLLRHTRNSFQINLRHSMEPPSLEKKTSRGSLRKSVLYANQAFFSLGKKREQNQKELVLEEIEEILVQGLKHLPEEILNFEEVYQDFVKKKALGDQENSKNDEKQMKLLLLYKSESKKAAVQTEKFKRTNELLEIESVHRSKLEEKHNELLKNFSALQEQMESLKKREKELMQTIQDTKMKNTAESPTNSLTSSLKNSLEFSVRSNEKGSRKPTKHPTKKKLPKETVGISPKLGQKINIENKTVNTGAQLLEKIKERRMKKFENYMHIKLVLKQIHLIYCERISQTKESELSKQQAFANIVYNYFLGLFGLKKIADRRFIIFILSLKKNSNIFRVNMFSRLLGLFDEKTNYSLEELNKYIEGLDFCLNVSTMGVAINNTESDTKFYIPFIRAIQYTSQFADTRMSNEENQLLKQEIESLKENDVKGINKAGIIDYDLFMERMLSKYRHLVNKAKTYVINAFAACDLDGNKMCNLEEFLLLNRHIEKEKYNKPLLKKIFIENADIDNDGEKNLSFDKFSHLCVEYNLFSDEAQNRYLQVTKKSQLEIKMEEVKITWYGKKFQLIESFDNFSVISKESKENWIKIIDVLEERIMGNQENSNSEQIKPTLIAYNILIQENELLAQRQKLKDQGEDIEEEESEEEQEEDERKSEKNQENTDISSKEEVLNKLPMEESVRAIEEANEIEEKFD